MTRARSMGCWVMSEQVSDSGSITHEKDASPGSTSSAKPSISNFTITPDVSEIWLAYQNFDVRKDGLISKDDLRLLMAKLGYHLTEWETENMIKRLTTDRDGRISFDESLAMYELLCAGDTALRHPDSASSPSDPDVQEPSELEEDATLIQAFQMFDWNRDGVFTAQELQAVLLDLGMPEGRSLRDCEQMIQTADADGNGVIDLVEFSNLIACYDFS